MLGILDKLGVNSTVFVQVLLWLIAYLFVKKILLDSLVHRVGLRKKLTVGAEEQTDKIIEDVNKKKAAYEMAAKKLDSEIKEIFSKDIKDTEKEIARKINLANKEAAGTLQLARSEILKQKESVQVELAKQVPQISSCIKEKIL